MRGMSLIEMAISLTISSILLAGLIQFSATITSKFKNERARLAVNRNIQMGRQELSYFLRGREADFWDSYPLQKDHIHRTDHQHGGIQTTLSCPTNPKTSCLIYWDIRSLDDQPIVYQIPEASFPNRVTLTPVDHSYPVGPSDRIGSMSVLFFYSKSQHFPLLVTGTQGLEVVLAKPEDQPWAAPTLLALTDYEVAHLGYLEITHIHLSATENHGRKLTYRPWTLNTKGWSGKRSRSSYTQMLELVWQPCKQGIPDRLHLIGQQANPPALTQNIHLGGKTFHKEICHATLEF